jgi:hypothetical protein
LFNVVNEARWKFEWGKGRWRFCVEFDLRPFCYEISKEFEFVKDQNQNEKENSIKMIVAGQPDKLEFFTKSLVSGFHGICCKQ